MPSGHILIADDDAGIRTVLNQALTRAGYEVRATGTVAGLWRWVAAGEGDLVITDVVMPDDNAFDLLPRIKRMRPDLPIIVMSAQNTFITAIKASERGAYEYLPKPFDLRELVAIVGRALAEPKRRREAAEAAAPAEVMPIVGRSPAMQDIFRVLARLMQTDLTVMISGESGTGKELVARLIHASGARHDNPFVPVNCGAIPSELMESELFGHKRGSFTGAIADKKGLVQSAEGGTLFLDEVADLPLHMQVKLLRLIQEKTARPIGEQREMPVDVRVLSATHKNLAELVAQGRFREDLYYRINVIEIRVPALREHREDIPELADAMLQRLSSRLGLPAPRISLQARAALEAYAFPGNVRELENILERATALSVSGIIDAPDLQLRPGSIPGAPAGNGPAPTAAPSALATPSGALAAAGLGDHLENIEREAIIKALEQTRYNKTAAAKLLGMSFRALRYRVKKLKIE